MSNATDHKPSKMLEQFTRARAVSTPLVAITTPDPAATMRGIQAHLNGSAPAIVTWDIARGMMPANDGGKKALAQIGEEVGIGNPPEALKAALNLPEDCILFMLNGHLFMDNNMVVQCVWNLRDFFKEDGRTLVILCPHITLPGELKNDVVVLDEPLPSASELEAIIGTQYSNAREVCDTIPELSPAVMAKAVDATVGLAAYPAEQVVAMSIKSTGIDQEGLWERKRTLIEQTPGLSIYRGGETFEDVAGNENVKTFVSRLLANSRRRIRAVVWLDEVEKMFAGLGHSGGPGDSSGTTQDQLQVLLKWMEDRQALGMLLMGFPGSGKSLIAKAAGNAAGVPTVEADLGAMKGQYVGTSEERIRTFTKTVDAMAPEGVLVIATCNSVGNMPPELLRRFKRGLFFFDLPAAAERRAAWRLHLAKNGLDAAELDTVDFDDGWTGAEIATTCEIAADLALSVKAASAYVVPIIRSMGDKVQQLRASASGRFLSASYAGHYDAEKVPAGGKTSPSKGRKLSVME